MRYFWLFFFLPIILCIDSPEEETYVTTPRLVSEKDSGHFFPNHLEVLIEYNGKKYIVQLEKKINAIKLDHDKDCLYTGKSLADPLSTARFTLCNGFHGVVNALNTSIYIYPKRSFRGDSIKKTIEHVHKVVIHSSFPIIKTDNDIIKIDSNETSKNEGNSRYKRDLYHVGQKSMKFLELYLVNDKSLYEYYNKDENLIEERCKLIADIIDDRYKHLHLRVILVGVEIWAKKDMVEIKGDSYLTLMEFMRYRQTNINRKIKNDNAQLISRTKMDNGRVAGKAPMATICNDANSAGVAHDNSENPNQVANVLTHEIGHNLGLHHDDRYKCYCNDHERGKCIMNTHVDGKVTKFSHCSNMKLQGIFSHGHGKCLSDFPVKDKNAVCGNGIIEGEEECDCGHPENCRKYGHCCDLFRCVLHKNATCASGECCSKCQFKKRSTLCRKKSGECDLEEYCSGNSGECPRDVYKQDTSSCENSLGYCVNGVCMSHNHQCYDWLGKNATAADAFCYKEFNVKGDSNGHCGKRKDGKYIKCHESDTYCGKVHCTVDQVNDITPNNIRSNELYWDSNQVALPCLSARIDDYVASGNLTLVKDGTRCGQNSTCYKNRCINTYEFRKKRHVQSCFHNCYGNGICNSQNNCHCNKGWDPPFCEYPGNGGSTDSGPMAYIDIQNKRDDKKPIFIIITVVSVTLGLLTVALLWRFSGKVLRKIKDKIAEKKDEVENEDLKELLLEK